MESSTTEKIGNITEAPLPEELDDQQAKLVASAAAAMAAEFGVDPGHFIIVRTDESEQSEETEPTLQEGDPGYDGIPHIEAKASKAARFALAYSGKLADIPNYDPESSKSITVGGKWVFPVEKYPPNDPNGVPSITIPEI